ncbi:MAG: hypothetical protein ABUL44_01725, partial [Flavobacterium sp.]
MLNQTDIKEWIPRIVVALLLITCCPLIALSQTPAQYVRKGDQSAEAGDWPMAFSYYQEAYEIDTPSFELTKKYADAAIHVKYYELAGELYDKNYQKDNGKLDPDGLYWIAMTQKYQGKYEDAQRNFKKYVKKYKATGNKELILKAEQEAKSAVWALNNFDNRYAQDQKLLINLGLFSPKLGPAEKVTGPVRTDESEISGVVYSNVLYYSVFENKQWTIKRAPLSESSLQPQAETLRSEECVAVSGV